MHRTLVIESPFFLLTSGNRIGKIMVFMIFGGDCMNRNTTIVKTGIIGIVTNICLSIFKAIIGIASHSMAISMDAVNNLSDALSSTITILGVKLANRPADKDHPMGHGRFEYLSSLFISFIILGAGVSCFTESIKKMIHPEPTHYTMYTLMIVVASIITKIILGIYTIKQGEKTNSDSLKGSGKDALFDAVISVTTFIGVLCTMWFNVNLDGFLSIAISFLILKAGYEMASHTVSDLLGRRIDAKLSIAVKKEIASIDGVLGAYDLLLHSYGPETYTGSCHIEVSEDLTAFQVDELSRIIIERIQDKFGITLCVGIYAMPTENNEHFRLRKQVSDIVRKHKGVLQVHGFHMNHTQKKLYFDMVIDFGIKDLDALVSEVKEDLAKLYPDWTIIIKLDISLSE